MELLFVVLIGAALGLAARAALPGRALIGVVLLPAIGAASAALVWSGLLWAGLPYAGAAEWGVAIVCSALSVAGAGVLVVRSRTLADAATLGRVSRSA